MWWFNKPTIDDLSKKKLQLRQQDTKGKIEECGMQRGGITSQKVGRDCARR